MRIVRLVKPRKTTRFRGGSFAKISPIRLRSDFGLIGLFVVYQTIEAEGLRELFGDIVSKRLSKASPLFLGWMADYEETRKLDMANALALALLIAKGLR